MHNGVCVDGSSEVEGSIGQKAVAMDCALWSGGKLSNSLRKLKFPFLWFLGSHGLPSFPFCYPNGRRLSVPGKRRTTGSLGPGDDLFLLQMPLSTSWC